MPSLLAKANEARYREMLTSVACLAYDAGGWHIASVSRELLDECDNEGLDDLDAGRGLTDDALARIRADLSTAPLSVFDRAPSLPNNVVPLRRRQEVPDMERTITLAEVRRGDHIVRYNGRPCDVVVEYVDQTPDFRVVIEYDGGKRLKGHRSTRVTVDDGHVSDGVQEALL